MKSSTLTGLFSLSLLSLVLMSAGCPPPLGKTDGGDAGDGGSRPICDGGNSGNCVAAAICGNCVQEDGEECDDGNTKPGDGCSNICTIEPGFQCLAACTACVAASECGNSFIESLEGCDDGNTTAGDGCSATCTVESGWKCLAPGRACVAAGCGDGIVAGNEECDDGNAVSGDGCSALCRFEKGYKCDVPGKPCTVAVCGNGMREGSEQCDDGNHDMGDGCAPDCTREPQCVNGVCQTVCGDGVLLPSELSDPNNCDDGNTRNGDGCSSTCRREKDWKCDYISQPAPPTFVVPLVIRDFFSAALAVTPGDPFIHEDFENGNAGLEPGIVGPLFTSLLDANGKPALAPGLTVSPKGTVHSRDGFAQWYRDTPKSKTLVSTMTLIPDGSGGYVFQTAGFFPLDNLGWVQAGNEKSSTANIGGLHNFNFTSEVRYWFEYKGTEKLDFTGDDDVFVFINKRLAVDIGGVHGAANGSIDLSDPTKAASLGLVIGGIYETVVFQAERHTAASNYKLTLKSFEKRSSSCVSMCGDGKLDTSEGEECDDGNRIDGDGCSSQCLRDIL